MSPPQGTSGAFPFLLIHQPDRKARARHPYLCSPETPSDGELRQILLVLLIGPDFDVAALQVFVGDKKYAW